MLRVPFYGEFYKIPLKAVAAAHCETHILKEMK
jgi:hypothetical protein